MADLVEDNSELPRSFSDSVTRAVMNPTPEGHVRWTDFVKNFPVAVRQRRILWDAWSRREDLQIAADPPLQSESYHDTT